LFQYYGTSPPLKKNNLCITLYLIFLYQWNPKENYYGREDVLCLDHFLNPEITEETGAVRGRKDFIFS
jgi:hypothetical protein